MAGSAQQQGNVSEAAAAEMSPYLYGKVPVQVGQGYDKVWGEARSTAVMTESISAEAKSRLKYSVCQIMTEVLAAFEIEQSLTVGLLDIGNASEKVRFVQSQKVTSTSVSIAIYSNHIEEIQSVIDVALKTDVQPPSSDQALREFFLGYGDCYVSSRTLGGEYCAFFLYSTETHEEQSDLVLQLQAAGIYGLGSSVDASLGTRINAFNSTTKVNVTSDQTITGIANPIFPQPDGMIDFARGFSSLELTAAVIIDIATTGYEHVPGITTFFNPIARNRFLIAEDPIFVDRLGKLVGLQNAIASIKNIYVFYGGYQDATLKQVEAEADADKQAVVDMVNKYSKVDPIAEVVQPSLTSIDKGTPEMDFVQKEAGPFGVEGPPQFDDVPRVRDYLLQLTRITEIQLAPGGVINWISTTFSDGTKSIHGGLGGGVPQLPAYLDAGTFVTSVSGSLGWGNKDSYCLSTLRIGLSDGREVPGGSPNHQGDQPFDWKVPADSFVVGFRGRSGWFLDQLRVVYVSFNPARWTE